jgi:RND family efflux transporter MFP subunit
MKRKILLSSAAVLAIAGAVAVVQGLGAGNKEVEVKDPRSFAPLVSVTKVRTPDTASRSFTGTVAARVQSDLGFRVPGKIVERLVGLGEEVKAGQPLMRIDDTDLRLALSARHNAVAAARATFIQAQADERRYAALLKTGVAASPQRYEVSKTALDTAAAQLAAAEDEAKVAENEVAYTVLTADADGTIAETYGEPGQVVAAGQPVLKLAKAGPREALVWLPENLRPGIGSLAQAAVYGQRTQDSASLRQISDAADPQTRTYETRWVLQGTAASAPLGATVTVTVENKDVQAHAEVPVGALLNDGIRTGVWALNEQTSSVHFREVSVERIGEEKAIVTSLSSGEIIVALGAHLLQDGTSVRAVMVKEEVAN